MELKDKIELKIKTLEFVKNKIDVIHKKIMILLSASAGSGALVFKDLNTFWLSVGFVLLIFFSYGLFYNYRKLSKLENEIEVLEIEIKRMFNVGH